MGRFLVVSKADRLEEYLNLVKEFDVAFEINDFFEPDVLDDQEKQRQIIGMYVNAGIPKGSTMHGAFYDVAVFSKDDRIRDVSVLRMEQSMQIAAKLGVSGVIFHTNYNPGLSDESYKEDFVESTVKTLAGLLDRYPNVNIYIENMFDETPEILVGIAGKLKQYKNFGVCLDWAHANVYGKVLEEWTEALSPYVKHIHINDNDLNRDLHLAVGSGRIDWAYFAKCYSEFFTGCNILVETNDPECQRKSLKFLGMLLEIGG